MNFCSYCSAPVSKQIPDGDSLYRYVCSECGLIHYQNPKIVAGCIVTWQDKVLLCRRAINPRKGLWTIPAGFMELGETVDSAAARETLEEAMADVQIDDLFCVYSIPQVSQVYVIFRGHLELREFDAGAESLEVALFSEKEIPWRALAFRVVHLALERYFEIRHEGDFRPYIDVV